MFLFLFFLVRPESSIGTRILNKHLLENQTLELLSDTHEFI
jgi:hypothetical protein